MKTYKLTINQLLEFSQAFKEESSPIDIGRFSTKVPALEVERYMLHKGIDEEK
jgi:hypothetical protein